MANDAVFQARMNSQLKKEVEELYREMGTTFSEAVRIFAQQSLLLGRMPFTVVGENLQSNPQTARPRSIPRRQADPHAGEECPHSGFAMFSHVANEDKQALEQASWSGAAAAKHRAVIASNPAGSEIR